MTYSYNPTKIRVRGKDQMRFELGDTLTDGGAATCALSDEEYEAMLADMPPGTGLSGGKRAWLGAKLQIVEFPNRLQCVTGWNFQNFQNFYLTSTLYYCANARII